MNCDTFLLHLRPGRSNAALLQAAADLAARCGARLAGITACQPMQIVYSEGCFIGDLIEQDLVAIGRDIAQAEAEFRATPGVAAGPLAWRSGNTQLGLANYLATQARSADLLIVGGRRPSSADATRDPDIGALIMQVGRPVLVVPEEAPTLDLGRILVAWKDTREARRATLDALPLLKLAAHVAIVEIAGRHHAQEAHERVSDVARWLNTHGIEAEASVRQSQGEDASLLDAVAQDMAADLVVAGAYGHSRLREWALGGVTRDLLLRLDRCVLLSH